MKPEEIDDRAREYVRMLDGMHSKETREAYMRAVLARMYRLGRESPPDVVHELVDSPLGGVGQNLRLNRIIVRKGPAPPGGAQDQ